MCVCVRVGWLICLLLIILDYLEIKIQSDNKPLLKVISAFIGSIVNDDNKTKILKTCVKQALFYLIYVYFIFVVGNE